MDTLLALYAACILRSGVDYAGYNLTKNNPQLLSTYRVAEAIGTAGLTYTLYEKYDLKTGGKFILLQWTFTNDLLYYGWAWAINPARDSGFEGRDAVRQYLFKNEPIPHARWTLLAPWGTAWQTPLGVTGQSLMGISVSIFF